MSKRLPSKVFTALAAALVVSAAVPADSPVADAAQRGDADRVRELLRGGADVNAAQGDGMTALHWSAENGDAALAEVLVRAGANVAAVTRLGDFTSLHIAARRSYAGVARVLLESGAEVEARVSAGGATALHFAAGAGATEVVRLLVGAGADVDAVEHAWDQTPLMFAAAAGRAETVRALLAAGADPSRTARVLNMAERDEEDGLDRDREEALYEQLQAAQAGTLVPSREEQRGNPFEPAARRGAPGGGDQPSRSAPGASDLPSRDAPGASDLPSRDEILLAQRDRRPTGRLSHAELVGGYGGLTPLLLAVREGHLATAVALLESGAGIEQKSVGDGTPPLVMATINGHFDLAMELLERGADPDAVSDAGANALYTTINTQWIPKSRHPQPADYMQQEVSYLDLMGALLERGADPNARLERQLWFTTFGDDYLRTDRTGATPFWRAAYALDLPAMKLLLGHGADPGVPTIATQGSASGRGGRGGGAEEGPDPSGLPPVPPGGAGAYPIHAASGIGYGEGYAGNIHRTVPDGWLPAVRFLVEELGADVNARDAKGYTPLHHAAARGDDELIEYLVSKGADPLAVARTGQTTVDMANGPVQRISPFPSTIALLESLGAVNNHNCVSC